jgi:hypothetical protein
MITDLLSYVFRLLLLQYNEKQLVINLVLVLIIAFLTR